MECKLFWGGIVFTLLVLFTNPRLQPVDNDMESIVQLDAYSLVFHVHPFGIYAYLCVWVEDAVYEKTGGYILITLKDHFKRYWYCYQ
jgi:hypothetical protein